VIFVAENLLSRKFIYAILATVMGFVLVMVDKVTADVFLKFLEVIGATYVIGNVGATVANRLPDGK
jgi:hypothetical protein